MTLDVRFDERKHLHVTGEDGEFFRVRCHIIGTHNA